MAVHDNPQPRFPEIVSGHHFPEFPADAYIGVGADFAELFARNYETPKEFFYFDFLILMANSLSGIVRADFGDLRTHTRLYGLKIGPSGTSKKSTSFDLAESFVKDAWSTALSSEEDLKEDEIWGGNEDRSRRAFKILAGIGSAEGVLEPLNDSRVLVYFDEFDRFIRKAKVDGSVIGTAFNELFERTCYANYTKDRQTAVENGHLGLLANIPLEQFESMAGSGRLVDLGLWNRLAYVVGDRRQICNLPTAVSPKALQELEIVLARYLIDLCERTEKKDEKQAAPAKELWPRKKEQRLQLTEEARREWARFPELIRTEESTTRLDTIGMRLMAVMAVTSGKKEIDLDVVRATLAFLHYQKVVRETYRPSQAETIDARIEESVLRQLRRCGPLKKRDLRRYTNADRYGTEKYERVLSALKGDQQIELREGTYALKNAT